MSLLQSLLKYLTPALTALALSAPAHATLPSLLLGISEAGAIGSFSKIAKNWTAQGGRVLWQSPKLPFWPVLASANVDDATINATKTALLELSNTPEGEAILKNVGVAGFAISEPAPYLAVLKWLDK